MTEVLELPYPEDPDKKPSDIQLPTPTQPEQEQADYPVEEIDLSGFVIDPADVPLLAGYDGLKEMNMIIREALADFLSEGVLDEATSRRFASLQEPIEKAYGAVIRNIVGEDDNLEAQLPLIATFWANDEEVRNRLYFEMNGYYAPDPRPYPSCLEVLEGTYNARTGAGSPTAAVIDTLCEQVVNGATIDLNNMILAIAQRSQMLKEQKETSIQHKPSAEAVSSPSRLRSLGSSLVRIAELSAGIALGITIADQVRKRLRP